MIFGFMFVKSHNKKSPKIYDKKITDEDVFGSHNSPPWKHNIDLGQGQLFSSYHISKSISISCRIWKIYVNIRKYMYCFFVLLSMEGIEWRKQNGRKQAGNTNVQGKEHSDD